MERRLKHVVEACQETSDNGRRSRSHSGVELSMEHQTIESPEVAKPEVTHPVHEIMSRTGSFPLHVAFTLLREFGTGSAVVFDPFCGKGTSLLAARMLGYAAYGSDVAPEAIVCSSAKLGDVSLGSLYSYIESLDAARCQDNSAPVDVLAFFHIATLSQILAIRQTLLADLSSVDSCRHDNAIFTLAALLGILHGHASYSLSIPSAHAYSMAPTYVRRYAAQHGLRRPERDVKECLRAKVARCLRVPLPEPVPWSVRRASALAASAAFPELLEKVDIVITSPPYLNAQTYAKDNWLRLWLLGYDFKVIRREYLATDSVQRYIDAMAIVFREIGRVLKPGGLLICIAGDVALHRNRQSGNSTKVVFRTGDVLAELSESSQVRFKVERYMEHTVSSHSRYLHSLSRTNGHTSRDLTERVFIARKGT